MEESDHDAMQTDTGSEVRKGITCTQKPTARRSRLHPSDGVFISMTMYNEDDARRLEEYRLLL
jgi:hypothetical protein